MVDELLGELPTLRIKVDEPNPARYADTMTMTMITATVPFFMPQAFLGPPLLTGCGVGISQERDEPVDRLERAENHLSCNDGV
jgi:hypothetical protein